jgi:hypothetical protein
MTCRKCGTEIAAKAIICYKCGTATAEPGTYRPNAGRDGSAGDGAGMKVPAYVWVIIAGLVAAAIWWFRYR